MAFKLATWNILADAYINPAWFPKTPPDLLRPEWRHPALLRHLQGLQADLLCLQEVEPGVFRFLDDGLAPLGYQGEYVQKGRGKPDGCAAFFRPDVLRPKGTRSLHYADGGGVQPNSGHLAQVLALEHEDRLLAVANTHLKWNAPAAPPSDRLGNRQMAQLLELRPALVPDAEAWVICGDFNVTQEDRTIEALRTAGFEHAFRDRPHLATCNPNGIARMIDYIFHTAALVSRPVDLPIIDNETPLPSAEHPSDHLPVVAWLAWAADRSSG